MALAQAILAALIDFPCSGYDLAKRFDGSVGFFWKASHQQIYRELAKLDTQGWVNSETIHQSSRPDKKLYSVTEFGQKQLVEWIAQPSEPTPEKEEILVKIFAGAHAPRTVILAELQRHRHAHQLRLATYQDIEQQYFQQPQSLSVQEKFQYLTLRRGLGFELGWLTWCDEAIQLLSQDTNS